LSAFTGHFIDTVDLFHSRGRGRIIFITQNFDYFVGADAYGSPQTQVQQRVADGVDPYSVVHDFCVLNIIFIT
jgi:hypothetical protein